MCVIHPLWKKTGAECVKKFLNCSQLEMQQGIQISVLGWEQAFRPCACISRWLTMGRKQEGEEKSSLFFQITDHTAGSQTTQFYLFIYYFRNLKQQHWSSVQVKTISVELLRSDVGPSDVTQRLQAFAIGVLKRHASFEMAFKQLCSRCLHFLLMKKKMSPKLSSYVCFEWLPTFVVAFEGIVKISQLGLEFFWYTFPCKKYCCLLKLCVCVLCVCLHIGVLVFKSMEARR